MDIRKVIPTHSQNERENTKFDYTIPTCRKVTSGWALNESEAVEGMRHYAHLLSFNSDLVRAELSLLRVMLPDGLLSVAMKAKVKEK